VPSGNSSNVSTDVAMTDEGALVLMRGVANTIEKIQKTDEQIAHMKSTLVAGTYYEGRYEGFRCTACAYPTLAVSQHTLNEDQLNHLDSLRRDAEKRKDKLLTIVKTYTTDVIRGFWCDPECEFRTQMNVIQGKLIKMVPLEQQSQLKLLYNKALRERFALAMCRIDPACIDIVQDAYVTGDNVNMVNYFENMGIGSLHSSGIDRIKLWVCNNDSSSEKPSVLDIFFEPSVFATFKDEDKVLLLKSYTHDELVRLVTNPASRHVILHLPQVASMPDFKRSLVTMAVNNIKTKIKLKRDRETALVALVAYSTEVDAVIEASCLIYEALMPRITELWDANDAAKKTALAKDYPIILWTQNWEKLLQVSNLKWIAGGMGLGSLGTNAFEMYLTITRKGYEPAAKATIARGLMGGVGCACVAMCIQFSIM